MQQPTEKPLKVILM